jgi:hypothetical protein
MLDRLGETL